MSYNQALYYPTIDFDDSDWLRPALLYWDRIRTIVPNTIDRPYQHNTSQQLFDNGILEPVRVASNMDEISSLIPDIIAFWESDEGIRVSSGQNFLIHHDSLPRRTDRIDIHSDKLPNDILDLLRRSNTQEHENEPWISTSSNFSDFYMTLLATKLSEIIGANLLTPGSSFSALANRAILNNRPHYYRPFRSNRSSAEYDAINSNKNAPPRLAEGMLADLTIQHVNVAPDTPVSDILSFRRRYADEMAEFRQAISEIAKAVDNEPTIESMRSRVQQIHDGQVRRTSRQLERALRGNRIQTISNSILTISLLSAAPSSAIGMYGASYALLAAAGISLAAKIVEYDVRRRRERSNNELSYLIALQRHFRRN